MLFQILSMCAAGSQWPRAHNCVAMHSVPWRTNHNAAGKWLNLKKAHVGGCHGYLEGHALTDIIINYGGCAPKGSWVSRACTIGKSLRVL